MKKFKVLLSVLLVVCMVVGFAPLHGTASAAKEDWEWYWSEEYRNRGHWNGWSYTDGWYELSDKWYQVDFSPVTVPVEINIPGTTSNGTATAAGSTTQMVGTSFSYFYNEWAGTLIIRGTGEMPAFSKEYPAPWANLKDKAARVILERNITRISSYAFVDFSRLRSVVLPATLKAIDPDAFLWSDETRALKTFRPLERLEYSGDLDTLDKVLQAANIKDLLDARIVKVTEKAIQDEIWQLTWYRVRRPVRVKYDKAGRPILIERVDKDGNYFRTAVTWDDTLADPNVHSPSQPLSPDTEAAGQSFTRDVIEKRETFSVTPEGVEHLYEFEKNDLGQTTYFAAFHLDNGAITGGRQEIYDETGLVKTGTIKSINRVGEDTYRLWENVLANGGGLEQMLEVLDKFGRVKSISTDKGDSIVNIYDEKTGLLDSRTVTESGETTLYTYNYNGASLQYVQADTIDPATSTVTATNTIKYTYNSNGSMDTKVQTEGTTTVTTLYNTYNRATKEVITDSGNIQYIYEYAYDLNGVVTQRTVKNKDGKVVGIDTFENGHIVKSVREMPAASGTKTVETTTYKYKDNTLESKETSTVTAKLSAKKAVASEAATGEGVEGAESTTLKTMSFTAAPETGLATSLFASRQLFGAGFRTLSLDLDGETDLDDEDFEIVSASKVTEILDEAGNPVKTETEDILEEGRLFASRSQEIQDGKQLAVSSSIIDGTGEEVQNDEYSKQSVLDANKDTYKINETSLDFSGNRMTAVHTLGPNEQLLASTIEESGEGGPTIVTDSTFIPHSDGSLTEEKLIFEKETKVTLGSNAIVHPAPEQEAGIVEDEVTGEEEDELDKDAVVTDKDAVVADKDGKDEEIENSKVPLADAPAAEGDGNDKNESKPAAGVKSAVAEEDEKDGSDKKADIILEDANDGKDEPSDKEEGDSKAEVVAAGDSKEPEAGKADVIVETEPEDKGADKTEPEDEDGDKTEPEDEGSDKTEPEDEGSDKTEPEDEGSDKTEPEDEGGDKTEPEDEGSDQDEMTEEEKERLKKQKEEEEKLRKQKEEEERLKKQKEAEAAKAAEASQKDEAPAAEPAPASEPAPAPAPEPASEQQEPVGEAA